MVEQQPHPSIQLDHIVALLPHRHLLAPPAWLTSNFTLTPGGRHADGKTENKLITFSDGTYIELISFIHDDPARRAGHWWGDKRDGLIDWAVTSVEPADVSRAASRIEQWKSKSDSGATALDRLTYAGQRQGGRRRPDGQEIGWLVAFPQGAKRGTVPFWCHDSSPRELRVPGEPQHVRHPCGAIGIRNVAVFTPHAARLSKGAYDAIMAHSGSPKSHGSWGDGFEWCVDTPQKLAAVPRPTVSLWDLPVDRQGYGLDNGAELRLELAVESSGEPQVPGPIRENVGLHGENQIDLSFVAAERRLPRWE